MNEEDPKCKNDALSAGRYAMTSLIHPYKKTNVYIHRPHIEMRSNHPIATRNRMWINR